MVQIILFAPLVGALIGGFFWQAIGEKPAQYLTTGLLFLACLLSWVVFVTFDGTTTTTGSTGITLAAGAFHVFRIDCASTANIRFFVDGVEMSTTGQFQFAATGANAVLQPYSSVYKASGTGIGTMQIDVIQAASDRV